MSRRLSVTILGCGCSTGIPRADGYWGACDPDNPKNRRSRCSAWFSLYNDDTPHLSTSVLVDTAPELREQAYRAGVKHLDAVLWTHDHADQTHGLDDIRGFTYATGVPVAGYMDSHTRDTLLSRFDYVFRGKYDYPAICREQLIPPHGTSWSVEGAGGVLPIVTFDQQHGPIRSVGYRLGNIAYSSDVSQIPEDSFAALEGLDVWIVDALRRKPHPTHAHLDLALEWVERVKPRLTILTNLHYELDYNVLKAELPEGVIPAYDQLRVDTILK